MAARDDHADFRESLADHDPSPETIDRLRKLARLKLQEIKHRAESERLRAEAAEIEARLLQDSVSPDRGPILKDSGFKDSGEPRVADSVSAAMSVKSIHDCQSWDDVLQLRQSSQKDRRGEPETFTRLDGGHSVDPKRPKFLATDTNDVPSDADANTEARHSAIQTETEEHPFDDVSPSIAIQDSSFLDADVDLETDDSDAANRKRKPAAMVASAVIHVVILLVLAGVTITNHRPKDQIAMTATTSSEETTEVETVEIETTELEASEYTEPIPTTPTEIADFEVTPISTDAIAMPTSDVIAPSLAKMAGNRGRGDSGGPKSLSNASDKSMRFCGVEGGGNHFVYLVDSSGSMGDAFDSARSELLASIDLLSPKQRFYVIFFDAEPDFMRITNPGVDESRSVYATDANKAAVRRWAMRITKDRGRAPYDPLRFALKLRPDVIFLLSDGEFPEGIAELLAEENRVDNLFGDDGPISIVHTIGYHSREGAAIMKRIADANQGQYRYVPRPE